MGTRNKQEKTKQKQKQRKDNNRNKNKKTNKQKLNIHHHISEYTLNPMGTLCKYYNMVRFSIVCQNIGNDIVFFISFVNIMSNISTDFKFSLRSHRQYPVIMIMGVIIYCSL